VPDSFPVSVAAGSEDCGSRPSRIFASVCLLLVGACFAACGSAGTEDSGRTSHSAGGAGDSATPAQGVATGTVVLTFGIVPQQAASRLAEQWGPLLKHVGEQAGVTLAFKTASDIPQFEERCASGAYDFAYMNPYHYTVFHATPGYEAIACRADKKIQGILVAKKGSGITQIGDLQGATVAFPAPRAFAATLLVSAGLRQAGVDFESKFVSSHDSVYLNVAKGRYRAGGGILRTFQSVDAEVRDELEVVWKTPLYTPHAFAVHPRIDAGVRAKVTEALLRLNDDEDGRAMLQELQIASLRAAIDTDWDDVRALEIKLR
jgi:phosphonate transport system substrate-binding protein